MKKAIIAKKIGMTQVFTENGALVPVTVLEAGPCVVVQKKTLENDGYEAIQVGFAEVKESKVTKPMKGHFTKAGVAAKKYVKEFRLEDVSAYEVGAEIKADVFAAGEKVDASGVSKGKGFQSTIKRYNASRGPMGHGSKYHRRSGSLGALGPNHVFKGRPLPGRMGGLKITVQNLQVVKVDAEKNLLLVKGSVPGPNKSMITIKSAVKAK